MGVGPNMLFGIKRNVSMGATLFKDDLKHTHTHTQTFHFSRDITCLVESE